MKKKNIKQESPQQRPKDQSATSKFQAVMNPFKIIVLRGNLMQKISSYSATFLLSIYYGLILNYPLYVKFELIQMKFNSILVDISFPLIFILLINLIFNFFNWKYLFKPFFITLTLVSSILFYGTYKFGVVFDQNMIQNIYETNVKEVLSYSNFSLFSWIFLFGFMPSVMLFFVKLSYPATFWVAMKKNICYSMICLLLAIGLLWLNFKEISFICRNNHNSIKYITPFYPLISLSKFFKTTSHPTAYKQLGLDAHVMPNSSNVARKPSLLVLVIGETARSHNFSLNGYSKHTNQFTDTLGVISFQNVHSCGTSTAVSIPCLFSNLTHSNYDNNIAKNQDGLLDILKHAGLSLQWIDNQSGCKNVCDRIPNTTIAAPYDGDLLKKIPSMMNDNKGDAVILLHLMGSHGPNYFERYPKSHQYFKPDCRKKDVQNCSREEIINSYDNTILYTDYFLSSLIKKLSNESNYQNSAMIYLSDHGESLGENGLFLHGMLYGMAPEYQKKIPLVMWFSPGFSKEKQLNIPCLQEKAQKSAFSHDHFFHSILGLLNIETTEYISNLDIFHECRQV